MANFAARSVDIHEFSMIPRADVPRSQFKMETAHKTTLDAGYLVPIYLEEVLPGDTFSVDMTAFVRLATPIVPILDNIYVDTFFFYVPNRLLWENFKRFMGERSPNTTSSIDYLVPQVNSPSGGYTACSLGDYFGLPVNLPTGGPVMQHNAFPFRAYNLIWNEWFRDQNLQDSVFVHTHDGPDAATSYKLLRRGKRHDYFTSALPWPQKGDSVMLPLGTDAPVIIDPASTRSAQLYYSNTKLPVSNGTSDKFGTNSVGTWGYNNQNIRLDPNETLIADLSDATAATINSIRQAFQLQKLYERDARGGTRYVENVYSHFGVRPPDYRLQRPEYLGGNSTPVNITPIAQTSATDLAGSESPMGTLAATGTAIIRNAGFTQSFTEHGYVIGLVSVRADLTYQQGMRRLWSRKTRYDFYLPVFAHLGEQAVLNKEIYYQKTVADDDVFGYQERWAEYRYNPSIITGMFRSTATGTLDYWHLSQRFTSLPTLSASFIEENPPISRVLAAGEQANNQQFIFDSIITNRAARPMPLYSVPGMIDQL